MDKSKVSDHNMLIYERYTDRAASDGASSITIKNMQNTVLPFLVWLEDIDVEKVTEDKIYAYFRYLKEFRFQRKDKLVGYSPMTLYNQKSYIKKFMSKYHPTVASTIKNPKITKRKLPEDILTQIEIKKLVKACLSERDRALVATLYETGMRRGEMRALKIKDVEFDTYGAVLSIPEEGKTGARRNRLVYCVSYLNEWLSVHPLGHDREAALFCSNHAPYGVLSTSGLADQLETLAKRAKITKKVTPHSFRHSRATHLTKFMTEQQMKVYLGWTAGSTMAAVYVHLSGKDIDDAILKHYGVPTEGSGEPDPFAVKRCLRCKEIIPESEERCLKCGYSEKDIIITKEDYDEIKADMEMANVVKQHEIEMAVEKRLADFQKQLTESMMNIRKNMKEEPVDPNSEENVWD